MEAQKPYRIILLIAFLLLLIFYIPVISRDPVKESPTPSSTFYPTNLSTRSFPSSSNPIQSTGTSVNGSLSTKDSDPSDSGSTDQVLVKFTNTIPDSQQEQYIKDAGAKVVARIPEIGVLVLDVPHGQAEEIVADLAARSGVLYAEPNYSVHATDMIPNDPDWSNQYDMIAIHAPQGWSIDTGAETVTIAILDTGVDLSHPDLIFKILPGIDFVNNDAVPQDDNGHGTHVAAIAAASTNNGIGVAGVDWGAKILPVKVLNATGNGTFSNVAAGIIWATDHGAKVINMSLGGSTASSTLEDAVDYAYAHHEILVAPTGNNGTGSVLYPAAYPPVIAVGATDSNNLRASFSNFGPQVDVSAPGVNIFSAYPGGGYGYRSGTSMAAPHVAGLVAILAGIVSNDPIQVEQIIESTSLDLGTAGKDNYYGYGLIQMDAAIQMALPTPTPTFAQTSTPIPTSTFAITGSAMAQVLPATGFSPNRTTILSPMLSGTNFSNLGDLWLEIPILGVEVSIVGVPQTMSGWDVSWLGDRAGWLNGTAFPAHAGNSVISAHVYDAFGRLGPFADLSQLLWGDQVIIHLSDQEVIYSVREILLVTPQDVSVVIRHEELPWLTLITCQGYDESSNSYHYRVVVRAVQVAVK